MKKRRSFRPMGLLRLLKSSLLLNFTRYSLLESKKKMSRRYIIVSTWANQKWIPPIRNLLRKTIQRTIHNKQTTINVVNDLNHTTESYRSKTTKANKLSIITLILLEKRRQLIKEPKTSTLKYTVMNKTV